MASAARKEKHAWRWGPQKRPLPNRGAGEWPGLNEGEGRTPLLQPPVAVKTPEQQARGPLGAQVPGVAWPGGKRPTVPPPSRTRGPGSGERGAGEGGGAARRPRRAVGPKVLRVGGRQRSRANPAPGAPPAGTGALRLSPRARYSGVPGNPAGKCGAASGQRRPRLGPRVPEAPAAGPTTRAGSRPEPSAPATQAACPCAGKRKRTN